LHIASNPLLSLLDAHTLLYTQRCVAFTNYLYSISYECILNSSNDQWTVSICNYKKITYNKITMMDYYVGNV